MFQINLSKSLPAVKTKKLQERRKEQLIATKAVKSKKPTITKKITPVSTKKEKDITAAKTVSSRQSKK